MSKLKYAMNFLADVPAWLMDEWREIFPYHPDPPDGCIFAQDLKRGDRLMAYDWVLDPSITLGNSEAMVLKVEKRTELYRTKILKLWKPCVSEVIVTLTDGRIVECDPEEPVELIA